MKPEALWEQYQSYTIDTSNNLRTLGLGSIGICWVFRNPDFSFPVSIRWVLLLTILYFITDSMQYFISAIIYRMWLYKEEASRIEAGISIETEMEKPRWLDSFAYSFWYVKFIFLIVAYLFIGFYILNVV